MLKVKAGDLDKMSLLFERHHKSLYGYLFHCTGQRVESEDLVQTVFYRMLKYRHSFSAEGQFRAWMYQLARNALIDSAQKSSKTSYQADILQHENWHENEQNIEHKMYENEQAARLHMALNTLASEHRELLILSKFQELPYKEIAEIMGTSEGNVKVKVHRAINELRNVYLKTHGKFQ